MFSVTGNRLKTRAQSCRTLTSSVTVVSRLRTWQRLLMNSSAGLVSWRAAPGLWGKASGPLPLYFLIAGTVSRTYFSVEKEGTLYFVFRSSFWFYSLARYSSTAVAGACPEAHGLDFGDELNEENNTSSRKHARHWAWGCSQFVFAKPNSYMH